MPSQLLERRPDLIEAEEPLRAANARVGEALAELLPAHRPHQRARLGERRPRLAARLGHRLLGARRPGRRADLHVRAQLVRLARLAARHRRGARRLRADRARRAPGDLGRARRAREARGGARAAGAGGDGARRRARASRARATSAGSRPTSRCSTRSSSSSPRSSTSRARGSTSGSRSSRSTARSAAGGRRAPSRRRCRSRSRPEHKAARVRRARRSHATLGISLRHGGSMRRCWRRRSSCVAALGSTRRAREDPLPSWNDGPSKQAIVAFVAKVTKADGPDFVAEPERIAVFDNDGTLWAEQPMYLQFVHRRPRQRARAPASGVEDQGAVPLGARERSEGPRRRRGAGARRADGGDAHRHDDRRVRRDRERVDRDGAAPEDRSGPTPRWCISRCSSSSPTFARTASRRSSSPAAAQEFMRPWTEQVYGIPPEQVIGSDGELQYEVEAGKPALMKLAEDRPDRRQGRQARRHPAASSVAGRSSRSATRTATARCSSGRRPATGPRFAAHRPPHRRRPRVRVRPRVADRHARQGARPGRRRRAGRSST